MSGQEQVPKERLLRGFRFMRGRPLLEAAVSHSRASVRASGGRKLCPPVLGRGNVGGIRLWAAGLTQRSPQGRTARNRRRLSAYGKARKGSALIMVPLLEIKTVPIEIQVKTKEASLEFSRGTAEMEISRSEQGGVNVKSRPIHVRLDTFENRSAAVQPNPVAAPQITPKSTPAPVSPPTSYEATTAYADQGQLMLNARIGQPAAQTQDQQPVYQPASGAAASNMSWEDGSLEIRYGMDKLNFDWKIDKGEFKFTPGDIQFTVKQRPDIIIKYTGGPIYVPRSSDPNYHPVDVEA